MKITEGEIRIDICALIEHMDEESQLKMIESLSCSDIVIKHVANQIITGWTENGYSGGRAVWASANPALGLDWAIREVALKSGDVAKSEIERMQKEIEYKDKQINELYGQIRNQNEHR